MRGIDAFVCVALCLRFMLVCVNVRNRLCLVVVLAVQRDLVPDSMSRWGHGPPVQVDAHGWPAVLSPTQRLGKLMLRNVQYHAPAGLYTVLYDGQGKLEFGMDARVVSRDQGRMVVRVNTTANLECHATLQPYCGDNGVFLEVCACVVMWCL